ncbi:Serine/threonine protein phosphatase PrpC [Sphingomonas laterariae]|uniref:Serine/threonine protein phosphatase PrpC n=1 Tax=Edaphosphingomonas laterariae TaxID=861865 RepID=A0A239H4B0_9SPHN|nr:bifunctional protein-serine/threonine kinase/phosphatase [Sphingomonas laterariae]SNS76200.1 Serine/threonine protein phosphatase PrpC [Sphingomonas laterariae]
MKPEGRLDIAAGFASTTGRREDNQDFGAVWLGNDGERARHGIAAAVADGVGGARGGRVASETTVRAFLDAYYALPETNGIAAAASKALASVNQWLNQIGRTDDALAGCATTFTALVLRGRRATALHVGDSRAWHFRDGQLHRLTQDHTLPQPDQRHILYRAVGIEPTVRLDVAVQDLAVHDRLLITSDGVHGTLSDRAIARLLDQRGSAQADADAIVAAAYAAGSQDNMTALVIDVVALPAIEQDMLAALAAALPVGATPQTGDSVDGFRLDRLISDGRYTRLFLAEDMVAGGELVLKFPKPALLSENGARLAFLRESLVGARIDDPYVGGAIAIAPERQSQLYIAMPYLPGETLEERLGRTPVTIDRGVQIAAQLARGVAALHRRGIVHRDIKPENVILPEGGGLKLIDLGVARLPRVEEFAQDEIPGTPSYMAPELYEGERGSEASDQFALGVTIYRLFTGKYPFGEVEAFSRPRFGQPVPPSRYRADMPGWLEATILRAIAVDPSRRFGDVLELVHALESGAAHAVRRPEARPLIERNPVLFWQLVSLVLAIALVASFATR